MPLINFSGLASGIDTNGLIEATSKATRKQRVEPSQTKVTQKEDENTALEELKSKFQNLQNKSKLFTTLSGGGLNKLASSSTESVATAVASNGALNGSYAINVSSLAKNATFSWDNEFSTTGATIGADGNISLSIGTGASQSTVNIAVTSSTTIAQFVDSFNAATSKAQASIVNVGTSASPKYRVFIASTKQGTTEGSITVNSDVGNLNTRTLSQATDAQFTVNGISGSITRSSNRITDVIPGLNLDLQSSGSTTVSVSDDIDTTESRIQDFVDSYNAIVNYVKEKNTVSRDESSTDTTNVFEALASTRIDDNSLQLVRNLISSSNFSTGSTVKILADIGITTQRDGTLGFDTAKFRSAISSEPTSVDGVLKKFADTAAVTGGTIDTIIRYNGLLDTTINANKQQITDTNKRIAEAEAQIIKEEERMRSSFARLESLMSKLQSQQSQLTSALAGLGR